MKGHDEDAKASNVGDVNGAGAPDELNAQTAETQPTANAAPAGIFSSPDMTVETENLPPELGGPQPEEVKATNKSRVTAAFGKRGGGNNQARIDSAFAGTEAVQEGVVARSNSIASSAEGDIRLQKSAKKKSKWPVVVVIIVLLVAVGAGVATMVLRGAGNQTVQSSPLDSTQKSFAEYANYLLFGEEKDTFDSEYSSSKSYLLNEKLKSDYDETYWAKSAELIGKAQDELSKAESPFKDRLTEFLGNYRKNFDFLRLYRRIGEPTQDALTGTYTTVGVDGAAAALDEFYYDFSVLRSDIADSYVEQKKQQYITLMKMYAVYEELGCMRNGTIEEVSCATPSVEQQQRVMTLAADMKRYSRAADLIVDNATRFVISYCWDLNDWFKNPETLEGETDE